MGMTGNNIKNKGMSALDQTENITGSHRFEHKLEESIEDAGEGSPVVQLDAKLQAYLGKKLRLQYQELVNEPVPEKFRKLLDELHRKEGTH
jgi:hypothetical protein